MKNTLLEKLPSYKAQLDDLDKRLSTPEVLNDNNEYKRLMVERSHLSPIVDSLSELKRICNEIEDAKLLKEDGDPELIAMAEDEIKNLESRKDEKEKECKMLLIPPDPLEGKNVIMEIRAGTGGEEAALFASDIYRMYSRYAEKMKWKVEIMNQNETEMGGYKEIVLSISGKNVYGNLRYEAGVHRVQRVPETESGGRIHTSAITVAILPEAEETDIQINEKDLKIDVMRAGGPGGQCVNTTDSAVRITHLPTGIVVIQQDEKSQLKNKNKAMRVLRSRLFEMEEEKKNKERSSERKSMVGTGDRSERIRTYNYPQSRCTDHRVNLTSYNLESVLEGNLDPFIEALKVKAGEDALENEGERT